MAYRPRQSFSEDEKDDARMLLAALRQFTALRGTMPLQYVTAFLQVVIDEGCSINDYSAKQGVAQSVMSRHIQDIGPRNRYGSGEGFNLVEQGINPVDPRNREVHLTQKGKGLYNAIRQAVAPFCTPKRRSK